MLLPWLDGSRNASLANLGEAFLLLVWGCNRKTLNCLVPTYLLAWVCARVSQWRILLLLPSPVGGKGAQLVIS